MFKNWIFLFASTSLFALTTLNVSISSDNNPGDIGEVGDLRYCLNRMNEELATTMDDYAIVFDTPMTIQLNGLLPIINNSSNPVQITIGNGGSIPTVTIDGNMGAYSGFFIPNGEVTIQNMIFQNMTATGGQGGNGTSGGGGGMGAGGAIYAPQFFLNGSNPSLTLMNVSINHCSAVGGNGGSYFSVSSPTGNEGGGGGGGFSGKGGDVTTTGATGGAGGGGFGGNGGNVTLSTDAPLGGGGGGGGGIGSRATLGTVVNLGSGGGDQDEGTDGNGYGLVISAGAGGGGLAGANRAGGGGGGGAVGGFTLSGGGGGGSSGGNGGVQPQGATPPGGAASSSGGHGVDGGGGGGGGIVTTSFVNYVDGKAGNGGYGGGGGGGAGTGAYDASYTVEGGSGGIGGGGGGGGANQSGQTPATGGNSLGGGGGGGGGPTDGDSALGGSDIGNLGGGAGGAGANTFGSGSGGGGGGGGSGLGAAIFMDSGLNLTLKALSGIPTIFNTSNNTTQAGVGGTGGGGGSNGLDGSSLGNSIFLRANSSLTLLAEDAEDLLTLGEEVSFVDDTLFGGGGTSVSVRGNGTIVYNGTADYQGSIYINNANFKVNGSIDQAPVFVCRNIGFSSQRGMLSGMGTLSGDVFVNSGTISPDSGEILTLGSLILSPADPMSGTLGSLVQIAIDSSGTSVVSVTGSTTLAGILEINLNSNAIPGAYTVLTSSGITGTFDSIAFRGATPNYSLSYLPIGSPTFVQFDFLGFFPSTPTLSTQGLRGNNLKVANYLNRLAPEADALGLTDQFDLLNSLPSSQYQKALEAISPSRITTATFAAQNTMFMLSESLHSHFTKRRRAIHPTKNRHASETVWLTDNKLGSPRNKINTPIKSTDSQIWGAIFGQFSKQDSQNQTPAFNFNSGAVLAAYDYGNLDQGCIGALAGYAFTSVHQHQSMGKSHINAGYLSVYGMKWFSDFFLNAAIWGNYMSIDQKRIISYPGFNQTANSSYHAGQLDLHFGTGYDFSLPTGIVEPFALLDWIVEWDPSYSEKGASPYNMKVSSRTSSMLRFETGLNGSHTATFSWLVLVTQAKLSYVYKKPYNIGHLHAAIVNAPALFSTEAFTASQNLVSPALELFGQTNWNGYGSIAYEGEFGSGYYSNQFYVKIGYLF